jgi:hypothetical protein
VATLAPGAFAARLGQIADSLRGLARTASDGLLEGMGTIAESAVERLVERTPRSESGDVFLAGAGIGPPDGHIADGWTARVDETAPGVLAIDVVNTHPRATRKVTLADGSVQDYTLLDILEYGSRRHEIRPVNAPALVFMGRRGGIVSKQVVNHPGTQPYAMVATTTADVNVDVKRLIDSTRRKLTLRVTGGKR